ncbi:ribonuclease HI [Coxiella endosymbiont of Amblyomma americanum]|uniref:ribonuclease HI n=1 Tax=Coxiella endosymbiont of Amblyomma americanum TaxID=325775 RepID=UPI00057DEBE3|nr:ribonuclease HI [Coxiella endosymbiont of Amblyomma americanum]AJC50467.1 ribonuclease H [Coxiella endosymbiont of Amblyomma americanum]AUJ58808.1 ribonuclease HI [Coxiella-like endosymbiont of Amblyomma americanum]
MKNDNIIYLYCDGACRGNPGPGGWGVLLRYNDHEYQFYNGVFNTTNNQMELTAAIEGLRSLRHSSHIIATTDSRYLYLGITKWLSAWKERKWKTCQGKPIKNRTLWESLEKETKRHKVYWKWVKGHSGHLENEIADRLANQGINELR